MDDLVRLLRAEPRPKTLKPRRWFRVHDGASGSLSFNSNPEANARFSAMFRPDGSVVPVLYAADCIEGALMETVFHEAPCPADGAHLRRAEIAAKNYVASEIDGLTGLSLVDLTSNGLRRVGLTRAQVIDSNAGSYPATRAFATHLYQTKPSIQGLQWMSRQYDRSLAILLFEDRIGSGSLVAAGPSRSVLEDDVEAVIMDLVDELGMRYLAA